jgi:hypothetical protein
MVQARSLRTIITPSANVITAIYKKYVSIQKPRCLTVRRKSNITPQTLESHRSPPPACLIALVSLASS